jgi:hypothetical protein
MYGYTQSAESVGRSYGSFGGFERKGFCDGDGARSPELRAASFWIESE